MDERSDSTLRGVGCNKSLPPRRTPLDVIGTVALFALSFLAVGAAEATTYGATGTIAALRSHDAAVSMDWFQVTAATAMGSCPTYNGLVIFVIKDDDRGWRHFAMALSAKRAGSTISAWVDDTIVNSGGYCYLQYMQE